LIERSLNNALLITYTLERVTVVYKVLAVYRYHHVALLSFWSVGRHCPSAVVPVGHGKLDARLGASGVGGGRDIHQIFTTSDLSLKIKINL
jgi:hypothetical protein